MTSPHPGGVVSYLVTVGSRFEDLQHLVEMLFAHEDLGLGVHVADSAVGGHDLDLLSTAGRVPEGADDVVGLVGHLGYNGTSPIV